MRFRGLHGGWRRDGRAIARRAVTRVAIVCAALAMTTVATAQQSYGATPAGTGLSGLREVIPGSHRAHARSPRKRTRKGLSLTPSATEAYWACPEEACEAIIDPTPQLVKVKGRRRFALPNGGPLLEGGGELGGLDPQDLQSAYKIPTSGGEGQTIALVDAYGYPTAEEDLAKYRERYGLPPCTKAGGCFKKVNQKGEEANYPIAKEGWETESALDIEMASAACPHCHILLAEANNNFGDNLAETVNTAARLGATEISNSYGIAEQSCGPNGVECEAEASDYDHPGILVTVSAGDSGWDNHANGNHSPNFPAGLPTVVAVGGTALYRASNARGWREQVWPGGGSGCTLFQAKPIWQTDTGCATRMEDDVAAVAACETPLSTFSHGHRGWDVVCGTSASSPLVAGIEAHATEYARSLPGADAFYQDPEAEFDVTAGSNGTCTPPEEHAYYCHAGPGYDAPTGNGTPNGPLELSSAPSPITITGTASAVANGEGTLNGRVDPEGVEASYHFEYGTTTAYGTSVPVPDTSVGSGRTAVSVSQSISGLEADTTYHYRLVATNTNGTADGADSAFSTAPPAVTGVSGDSGPTDGATTVTITGTHLDSASAVKFGPREAESFTVESEGSIRAVSPQGDGTVDVTVTTPVATSETTAGDRFVYDTLGPVLAWGRNADRLGDLSEGFASSVPVEASDVPEAAALAASYGDSFALLGDGTVMGWGAGAFGLTNGGFLSGSDVPVHICKKDEAECPESEYLTEVTAIAAGDFHVLALLKDGTVDGWGENELGQLADGSESPISLRPNPVCMKLESPCKPENELKEVVAIAAGEFFSLALLRNGTVMAWGENERGVLGTGKAKGPNTCEPEEHVKAPCSLVPVLVGHLSEVTAISAGGGHALALLRSGKMMAWGGNVEGELGDGATAQRDTPTAVCAAGELAPCSHTLDEVSAVSAGQFTSMALLKDGSVLDWGTNFNGELGDGSFSGPEACGSESCSRSPVLVSGLHEVSAIATGSQDTTSMAIAGGTPMTWGGDKYGQLGDGVETPSPSDTPVHVCQAFALSPCPNGPYLSGEVSAIAVGGQHDLVSFRSSSASVSRVSPAAGPGKGATTVTITGSQLSGATAVHFGAVAASEFEVRSASEVVALSPPGSGVVDVTVTTPEGASHSSLADRFSYEASTVTGLSPAAGSASGNTPVTITGSKLSGATAVHFGAVAASEFEVRSASEVVAVSPPGSGVVDVTVTTPEGTSAANPADRFVYQASPTVLTQAASAVHLGSAALNATVDPEGASVGDCHFDYGASPAYGSSAPCTSSPGSGSTAVPVLASVSGLSVNATYHFRIVASNSQGTSYGADETFTTPSSELPELGRCVKLGGRAGSRYKNATCTVVSIGGDTGKYEWESGPGASSGFSAKGGAATVGTAFGLKIPALQCTESAITGNYTGAQTASLSLVLSGCMSPLANRAQCHSEGAAEGQIIAALHAQLGIISAAARKLSLGWDLQPASGGKLAVFTCGTAQFSLVGSVVGPLASADKISGSFSLAFATVNGQQAPEGFEGGFRDVPSLSLGSEEVPVTLTMSATITDEEPLELKGLP
jgi:alpha-tubulin suppressor-like RCC1 family protein